MLSLVIAFQEPGSKPLSVAVVHDHALLHQAARAALAEAEREVVETTRESPMLGRLRAAEVLRLRTTLALLIPEIALDHGPCPAQAM